VCAGSIAPLQANVGVRSVGSGGQADKANINQYYLAEVRNHLSAHERVND
jgi:hypothetical protein